MRSGSRDAGFTLLEALIALAIVATAFAVAFWAIPQSARSQRAASDLEDAASVADSLLAQANPGAIGTGTGQTGRFAWRIEAGPPEGQATVAGTLQAQAIRITIAWPENGHTRSIAIQSVHLSAPPQ